MCCESDVTAPVCSAHSLQSLQSSIKCGLGSFHRPGKSAVRHRKLPDKRHARWPALLFIFLISLLSDCWYGNSGINAIYDALPNRGIMEAAEEFIVSERSRMGHKYEVASSLWSWGTLSGGSVCLRITISCHWPVMKLTPCKHSVNAVRPLHPPTHTTQLNTIRSSCIIQNTKIEVNWFNWKQYFMISYIILSSGLASTAKQTYHTAQCKDNTAEQM